MTVYDGKEMTLERTCPGTRFDPVSEVAVRVSQSNSLTPEARQNYIKKGILQG